MLTQCLFFLFGACLRKVGRNAGANTKSKAVLPSCGFRETKHRPCLAGLLVCAMFLSAHVFRMIGGRQRKAGEWPWRDGNPLVVALVPSGRRRDFGPQLASGPRVRHNHGPIHGASLKQCSPLARNDWLVNVAQTQSQKEAVCIPACRQHGNLQQSTFVKGQVTRRRLRAWAGPNKAFWSDTKMDAFEQEL